MKTKKECLIDLEFSEEEIKELIDFNKIKKRYIDLIRNYNLDNGLNKDRNKYESILQAFKLLKAYYKENDSIDTTIIIDSIVSIVLESEGFASGGVYAIDYKNEIACLIWSPHWRSDVHYEDRFTKIGVIGLAYSTEIILRRCNIIPFLRNPIIIKENIPSNLSQEELEGILLNYGLPVLSKKKSLE